MMEEAAAVLVGLDERQSKIELEYHTLKSELALLVRRTLD